MYIQNNFVADHLTFKKINDIAMKSTYICSFLVIVRILWDGKLIIYSLFAILNSCQKYFCVIITQIYIQIPYNVIFFYQLHAVSRTQQGKQREPSVKTLRSPLPVEFWRHRVLSGRKIILIRFVFIVTLLGG